jgi:hypothetical protein
MIYSHAHTQLSQIYQLRVYVPIMISRLASWPSMDPPVIPVSVIHLQAGDVLATGYLAKVVSSITCKLILSLQPTV